jgi:hypothetical protein
VLLAVEIDDFPIQPGKLIEERFLNVVAFVDLDVYGRLVLDRWASFAL